MKKTTKGALAAGAAGALLLGGAGSLAYWSDSTPISGGSISSGELALSEAACDTNWVYATGNAKAGESVGKIVPGDSITKSCTFTITAAGDNLAATLTAPDSTTVTVSSTPAPTTLDLGVSAAYSIDGAAVPATITSAQNGKTVTAALTVNFPIGDESAINANDTQNLTASLDDINVSLVQNHS